MFKTELDNVKLKFGTRSLLQEAYYALTRLTPARFIKKIRDQYGAIAYRINDYYLVAKKSPYGDIVSVDKAIWDEAKEKKRKIVMFIQSSRYFYQFDPDTIRETSTNERGDKMMINFGIREGINFMKVAEAQKIVKKNKGYRSKLVEEAWRCTQCQTMNPTGSEECLICYKRK